MVKCPNCGAFNEDASRFCVQCGTRLPPGSQPVSSPPGTQPQIPTPSAPPPGPSSPPPVAGAAGTGQAPVPLAGATRAGRAQPRTQPVVVHPGVPADATASHLRAKSNPPPHKLTQPGISQPPPISAPSQRPAIRSGFAASLKQTQVGFPAPGEAKSPDDTAASLSDAIARAAPPVAAPATAGTTPATPDVAAGAATVSTPPAAGATTPNQDVSELPFGDLIDDIDTGFERIVQEPGPSSAPATSELGEVRDLFNQIAATHMGPVRDFVIELKLGEPPREWVDLVQPAVSTLRKSAAGMGLDDLCVSLDAFLGALEVAARLDRPTLTDEPKDRLLRAYAQVAEAMPEVFSLDDERDRREPVIVQSLLKQVPDVRKVALDKLYGAGLTSLGMYYVAKPYDVAEAAGISLDLAARIVNRFVSYKREVAGLAPDAGRSREYAQLDQLSNRLREQNTAFDVASKGWSRGAGKDKRRLRKERAETVLRINVLLARLGEVDLVGRLERLPFHTKVDVLDEYLQDAKNASMQHAHAGGNQGK